MEEEPFGQKILVLILLTLCSSETTILKYCNSDITFNVCLYSEGKNVTKSFIDAQSYCRGKSQSLLEIYNQSYANLVDQAVNLWLEFKNTSLWLNLKNNNSDFYYWMESGLRASFFNWGSIPVKTKENCVFYQNSQWYSESNCSRSYAFICMETSIVSSETSGPIETFNSNLFTGLIAGICVIAILFILAVIAVVVICLKYQRLKRRPVESKFIVGRTATLAPYDDDKSITDSSSLGSELTVSNAYDRVIHAIQPYLVKQTRPPYAVPNKNPTVDGYERKVEPVQNQYMELRDSVSN